MTILQEEKKLNQYDYVIRTNLSSFWIFDRLNQYLRTQPRNGFLHAVIPRLLPKYGKGFPSGAGFILSTDLAQLLINKQQDLNYADCNDDVEIGIFFIKNNVEIIPAKRYDFVNNSLKKIDKRINHIPKNIYHIRIKNKDRIKYDKIIIKKLLKHFYHMN